MVIKNNLGDERTQKSPSMHHDQLPFSFKPDPDSLPPPPKRSPD